MFPGLLRILSVAAWIQGYFLCVSKIISPTMASFLSSHVLFIFLILIFFLLFPLRFLQASFAVFTMLCFFQLGLGIGSDFLPLFLILSRILSPDFWLFVTGRLSACCSLSSS